MALFDNLMVISHGKTLYFGPSTQVVDYFASVGFKCPEYENPGDYLSIYDFLAITRLSFVLFLLKNAPL
jgi:ABC-type multidrug transport system ATPase subunit